jgi:GAF domain-containing protein
MAEGLAEIGQILQANEDDMQIVYDRLISTVVTFMKVNQGGLYLVQDDEEKVIIELKSCYAYDRKKFVEKLIEPGQGLIGQCYLEQEQILLKEVPTGYVTITSGLGESSPSSVLIVPLTLNDKVEAIIEVASFGQFESHHIDFLNQLGEGVASKVSTIKIDQRTKILLENSQTQGEELRAQEEEMRQNMEELQATQEEMSRKEQEYLERIAQLEIQVGKSVIV